MAWKTIDDVALAGKTVLTRVDINVPMEGDAVTDTTRIDKISPRSKISSRVAAKWCCWPTLTGPRARSCRQ